MRPTASVNSSHDAKIVPSPPATEADDEAPAGQPDQPALDDGESAKADNVTDGGQYEGSSTESKPPTPSCGGSEKVPSTLPEYAPGKSEVPSLKTAKDPSYGAPRSNAEVDGPSGSDPINMPSESPKKAGTSRDDISGKSANSLGSEKEERQSKPKNRSRKGPSEAGGRRTRDSTNSQSRSQRQPISRPELICRKHGWQWRVILSANEECQIKEVRHNDESLTMVNGECCLSSFTGPLSIVFEDDERDEFSMFDDKPLIFKQRNLWIGDGCKVNGITKGYFVVIAPNEWERTGRVPVEPEGCADTRFRAHYYFRDNRDSEEDIGGFRECEISLTASRLELNGERVLDDSEEGELFVGSVPNLTTSQDIAWIRVGAEEKNGWKGENFKPDEQAFAKILGRRQGRFFVRVYNDELKLLDSCEFRYFRHLKEILVNDKSYTEHTILTPSSTGHLPTKVRFIGADDTSIHPILPPEVAHAKLEGDNLIVEPHPGGDDISFALGLDTSRVDVVLHLPRIWWRMEWDAGEDGMWHDTPLAMARSEFREYADVNTTIRLRLPRRIKSIRVGFDNELDRVYRAGKEEATDRSLLVIPLADFVDYSQIDQRLNEDALLNVECDETTLTLVRVSRDPAPMIVSFTCEPVTVTVGERATLRWMTRDTEAANVAIDPGIGAVESNGSLEITPSKNTAYTLRLTASGLEDVTKAVTVTVNSLPQSDEKPSARVIRANGGWKHGKGFSYGELEEAGLATADAAHRSVPIDRRRRSAHRENVETIRRLIDA